VNDVKSRYVLCLSNISISRFALFERAGGASGRDSFLFSGLAALVPTPAPQCAGTP
jgi:hypothetical protein